jgi:hypothetical protein
MRPKWRILLLIVLSLGLFLAPSLADSRQHRAATKICRQRYKAAIRGLKYLKHRARQARIAAAKKERDECLALAPK